MQAPSQAQRSPDRVASGRRFRLLARSYVEGRVVWKGGCAVPWARVRIFAGGQAPVEVQAVQGRFSVHGLPPGRYRVEVVVGRSVVARRVLVPPDGGAFIQLRLAPARAPTRVAR